MGTDPATPLLRRVRWGNVARLAGAFAALALVLAWPRLRPHEPRLPPAGARPVERREPWRAREPPRPKKRAPRTAKRGERPARRKRSPVEAKRPQRATRPQARHLVRPVPAPPPPPTPKSNAAPRHPSGGEFVFG